MYARLQTHITIVVHSWCSVSAWKYIPVNTEILITLTITCNCIDNSSTHIIIITIVVVDGVGVGVHK